MSDVVSCWLNECRGCKCFKTVLIFGRFCGAKFQHKLQISHTALLTVVGCSGNFPVATSTRILALLLCSPNGNFPEVNSWCLGIQKTRRYRQTLRTRIVIPQAHTSLSSVWMASSSCSSGEVHRGFPAVLGAENAVAEVRTFERPKSAMTGIPLLDIKILSFQASVTSVHFNDINLALTPRKSPCTMRLECKYRMPRHAPLIYHISH